MEVQYYLHQLSSLREGRQVLDYSYLLIHNGKIELWTARSPSLGVCVSMVVFYVKAVCSDDK